MSKAISTVLLITLAGCAAPAPVPLIPSAHVDASALNSTGKAASASVHIITLCTPREMRKGGPTGYSGTDILIDNKLVAKISSCDYRRIPLPAGTHAIRLKTTYLDVTAPFGAGANFTVQENGHAYFVLDRLYDGGALIAQAVPEERGKSLVAVMTALRAKK